MYVDQCGEFLFGGLRRDYADYFLRIKSFLFLPEMFYVKIGARGDAF